MYIIDGEGGRSPPDAERRGSAKTPRPSEIKNAASSNGANIPSGPEPQDLAALRQAANRQLRRQREIEGIYRLGERCVYELIAQLDRERIDPEILRAVGGDRFSGASIRVVGGGS